MRLALAVVLVASSTAHAKPDPRTDAISLAEFLVENFDFHRNREDDDDPKKDLLWNDTQLAPAAFRFDVGNGVDTAKTYDRFVHRKSEDYYNQYEGSLYDFGLAKDGSAGWVDYTVTERDGCFDGAPGERCPFRRFQHAALLVAVSGGKVRPIASHVAALTSAARGTADAEALPDDALAPEAKAVADAFTASIGSPAALAKTVSARPDVVLLGSAPKERFVGGAAVRAQLLKWKLAFKVHDHVAAGLASKTVGWVAANLDANQATYRALFVYELTGGAWQLVQASFSLPQK